MKDLTKKIKEIRKFARFGLIQLSSHALDRAKERHISTKDIMSMLMDNNNFICQSHVQYKNNENISYTIWAKNPTNKNYYHIVVYDNGKYGGHAYNVGTCYQCEDSEFFMEKGKVLKNKKERAKSVIKY